VIYQRAKIIHHKDYGIEVVGRLLWVIAERPVRFTGIIESQLSGRPFPMDEDAYYTNLLDKHGVRVIVQKSRVELLPERGENIMLEPFSTWLVRKDV